jgi:hypothetical protein
MDNPDFYDQSMNTIEDFGNERYLLVVSEFKVNVIIHLKLRL